PPDIAEVVIAPLLGELLQTHPGLRVSLDPGETLLDLTRREADIALRVVRPERGDLVMTKLMSFPWVLAAAPERARAIGTLRKWTDAPWIGFGQRFAHVPPERWFAAHVPGTEPVVRSDSVTVRIATLA